MDKIRRRLLKTGVIGSAAVAAGCTTEISEDENAATEPWRPLRILILGGTGFIGPHMVREALRRGHEVELFNRGRTNSELFPDLTLLVGDRNNGLDALEGGNWDAVVDNSGYVPRQVADSAKLLAPVVSHYVFISTISVYGEISNPIDEDTPVGKLEDESVEEVTGETFGPLKALCEQRVISEMGADRTTVLRPTYICGPGDRTDRYSYWPIRSMRGGEMLWPGTPDDDIQVIDVRDLANFTLDCLEQKIAGVYNTVTPKGSFRMGDLLEDCQAVTTSDASPTWVSADFLKDQEGVVLPIWEDPAGENAELSKVDGSRAAAAGLKNRPTRETARDTVAWWKTLPAERAASTRAGLSPEKEAALLSLWHDHQA
jgi:2'-hydroxyisoflavone reductase